MLKHTKNVQSAGANLKKTLSMSFNPSMSKLAVANFDRTVTFFNAEYVKKDRMPTRGADKTNKNYMVRALAFSPDSNILTMAQSDNILYSYKVGAKFGDKKSICSKIPLESPPSCIQWPSDRLFEFFFGDNAGNVNLAKIKSHKASVLYKTGSYCMSLSLNPSNTQLVSGHLDKSIYIFSLSSNRKKLLTTAQTVPQALAIGHHVGKSICWMCAWVNFSVRRE
jgi:intraflagellar transport protein 172